MRRLTVIVSVIALFATACGDDNPLVASTAAPTSSEAASTTEAPTTTKSETTAPATTAAATTTEATTTAPPPERMASDVLAGTGFFTMVEDLDRAIAEAAVLFNQQWDADANTLGQAAQTDILALDAMHVAEAIPPGLPQEVEDAAMAVYADLDSRISAMHGAVRYLSNSEWVRDCLGYGATSFERFDGDWSLLHDLARLTPAGPTPAPDSVEAGVLATRIEALRLWNWGCDSCGGAAYEETIPVDWEGRTVMEGVTFEADFDGGRWIIRIHAC